MDLLDLLNAPSERTEPIDKKVALEANASKENLRETSQEDEDVKNNGEWQAAGNEPKASAKRSQVPEMRDTELKSNIASSDFVWARNNWFRSQSHGKNTSSKPWFPARICADKEALMIKEIPNTIPQGQKVLEFINSTKVGPAVRRLALVEDKEIIPFHQDVTEVHLGSSPTKKSNGKQRNLLECGVVQVKQETRAGDAKLWNTTSVLNLQEFLAFYYSADVGKVVHERVMAKARAYLEKSQREEGEDPLMATQVEQDECAGQTGELLYGSGGEEGEKEKEKEKEEEEEEQGEDDDDDDDYAAKDQPDSKGGNTLKAGDWVSYVHKVFGSVMYTRVVQIKARVDAQTNRKEKHRLVVENGEVLSLSDEIRRLATITSGPNAGQYDKSNGTRYRAVGAWRMQAGVDTSLKTIHQQGASLGKGNKLTRKTGNLQKEREKLLGVEGGRSSAKKTKTHEFVDTQSSDGDEHEEESRSPRDDCSPTLKRELSSDSLDSLDIPASKKKLQKVDDEEEDDIFG
jgi:hypothetical protein